MPLLLLQLLAPRFAYLPALAQQCLSFFQVCSSASSHVNSTCYALQIVATHEAAAVLANTTCSGGTCPHAITLSALLLLGCTSMCCFRCQDKSKTSLHHGLSTRALHSAGKIDWVLTLPWQCKDTHAWLQGAVTGHAEPKPSLTVSIRLLVYTSCTHHQLHDSPCVNRALHVFRRTQPLGVLHDLLTPQSMQWPSQHQQQQHSQQGSAAFSTSAIPWCLTVHFRNQPASLVNSWQNNGTAQDHYLSSLKVTKMRPLLKPCRCCSTMLVRLCTQTHCRPGRCKVLCLH